MRRAVRNTCAAGMIVAAMMFALDAPAFAGTAYGATTYFTVAGYSYSAQSSINTCSGCATIAETFEQTTNYVSPPAGWEEARAYIYYSDGTVCHMGSWVYNGNGSYAILSQAYPACGCNIAYYGDGIAGAWNGSGYQTGFTPRSPNQTGCVS